MKKLLYVLIFILAAQGKISAQSLTIRSYVEKTSVSPKRGIAVGVKFPCNIEIGGFHQKESSMVVSSEKEPWRYEKEFYGFFFQYPVYSKGSLDLGFNIRTGLSNNENFVITPAITADYRIGRLLSVGAAFGSRAMSPTISAGVKINLKSW